MTDILPPVADATMTGGVFPSVASLSMKMGAGGNIDKTSQDFEAMFATQMLSPMFEGIGADPTFGGGNGEEVMKSFLLQEYGKLIAKSGKFGIAAQVKNEMIRAQEGGHARGASSIAKNAKASYTAAASQGADNNVTVQ